MKEVKIGMGKMEVIISDERRIWRSPDFSYSDGLVLCSKSERSKSDDKTLC